ncbi:MAG: Sua5/YciO/YrdC/YwlC family protein [Kangiellaceae bacterium]|nr:Sua5/YciO/YrdC/YwlC family protein [Kangiellaceae bacterium]
MPYINLFKIKQATAFIEHGGVIAYPTEAVYGLGCDPQCVPAIQRILRIKRRPWQKGLLLVASNLQQIEPYVAENARELLSCFDDKKAYPVTWLLPASSLVSPWLKGEHEKIAIRLSDNPYIRALCDQAQSALVSTSANRAGQLELKQAELVRCSMGQELDAVVAGSVGGYDHPSAIIDAKTEQILRAYK